MFDVTPRTSVTNGDMTMSDDQVYSLAYDLEQCLKYEMYNGYIHVTYADLQDNVDLTKLVTDEGKLAKRISKYIKKAHDRELTSKDLDKIGNVIAYHFPSTFTYDIVDEITWYRGEFGDGGSCFWGDRSDAKQIIVEGGGRALRFFNGEDEGSSGNGRCWVMPTGNEDEWVVFNAYGPNLDAVEARLEFIYPDAYLKKVKMTNFDDECGLLYINDGRAILVSTTERIGVRRIDLQAGSEHMQCCQDCERWISEDAGYFIEYNERTVCDECYNENYARCWQCEEMCHQDSLYSTDIRYRANVWLRTYAFLCESCTQDGCDCDECGHWTAEDMTDINDSYVCGYCVKNNYIKCRTCDTYYRDNGEDTCECQSDDDEEENDEPVEVETTLDMLVNKAMEIISKANQPTRVTPNMVLDDIMWNQNQMRGRQDMTMVMSNQTWAIYPVETNTVEQYVAQGWVEIA